MFNKDQFIGREDIVNLINKRLFDLKEGYRQNIALIGEKLIGKSWIIRYVFDDLKDYGIIPVYFDLSQSDTNIFTKRFLGALFFNFLKTRNIQLPKEDLACLIEKAKPYIPKTVLRAQQIISLLKDDRGKLDIVAFREIFDVIALLNEEAKQSMVVILDEFLSLEELKIKNVFQEFGKRIMTQRNIMYIISSAHKVRAKKVIQEELSLLFGNFEVIDVKHFDNKVSTALIKNKIKNINIPQETINFLINFTGGHPFYLDKITRVIYKNSLLLKAVEVTPELLIRSLEDILFNEWGMLNLCFKNNLKLFFKNRGDLEEILLLIAQGKNKIRDLALILHKKQNEIVQKVSSLTEEGVVYRAGAFYNISERVFNFWLNFVYGEKRQSISYSYEDQVLSFRKKIREELRSFVEISQKDLSQRLYELLSLFSDDAIVLGKNKIMLSHFKQIKPLIFNREHIKNGFMGLCNDECWIIGFKKGDITEYCISEFLEESKKFEDKFKQFRRLIIGLENTEVNAKLLAKEEKVITWDMNQLNTLMDSYGKPRLVI